MDISMPELDGVAATGLIRGSDGPNRRTPIIALTAHAMPEDTQRFLSAGITDTLIKPLSVAALQQALAGVKVETAMAEVSDTFTDLAQSLGRDKAARLLVAFEAEGEALVARTATAEWKAATPREKAEAVHKLAGSASVLGAGRLRVVLQKLEDEYRRGAAADPARGLMDLARAWQDTRDQIRTILETPVES